MLVLMLERNWVLLKTLVACAERLNANRSPILNVFSTERLLFQVLGARMALNEAADVPYQKRSATTEPFGVVTVRPAKASMLYFRKQQILRTKTHEFIISCKDGIIP